MYQMRDSYVIPALLQVNKSPYLGTADAVTAAYLMKYRKNIDYVSLSLFFGGIEDTTIERWVHYVEDYIYATGPLLVALRLLSNVPTKTALFEELAGATMSNSRAYHAFEGMFNQFKLQNPHIVATKLVIIAWDSRHIPIPYSSSFNN